MSTTWSRFSVATGPGKLGCQRARAKRGGPAAGATLSFASVTENPMPAATAEPFRHAAMFYDGQESFLSAVVPFIREGVAAGDAVMVAVDAEKTEVLGARLGRDSRDVEFVDMASLGANPARLIPTWEAFLDRISPGRPVRGIGEPIWAGRPEDEVAECQLHEALVNRAFAGADGVQLLCPYDTAALSTPVLQEACRSHPFIVADDRHVASRDYRGADAVPPPAQAPLAPPPANAQALGFDRHNLAEVRTLVADCASRAGLSPTEAGQFVLGVHELAANSVRHAGGIGVLRAWLENGAAVCEVRDTGHIEDPLAGRHAPRPGQLGGWGLWLANEACDLLQIRTGPTGTVVRARRAR